MKLRPALFLMAAAGGLAPTTGAGSGAGSFTESSNANGPEGQDGGDENETTTAKDDKVSSPSKRMQAEWKNKRYAAIAAHHTHLQAIGKYDEAAMFHDLVVKPFKDKK